MKSSTIESKPTLILGLTYLFSKKLTMDSLKLPLNMLDSIIGQVYTLTMACRWQLITLHATNSYKQHPLSL